MLLKGTGTDVWKKVSQVNMEYLFLKSRLLCIIVGSALSVNEIWQACF